MATYILNDANSSSSSTTLSCEPPVSAVISSVPSMVCHEVPRFCSRTASRLMNEVIVVRGVRKYVRSEEHTSELQSLMRISYDVFCLKKKTNKNKTPLNRLSS